MEILLELIVEILLEGSMEIGANTKISRWIRYPILLILILFFTFIISVILFFGLYLLRKNIFVAFVIICFDVFLFVSSIKKLKKLYLKEKRLRV